MIIRFNSLLFFCIWPFITQAQGLDFIIRKHLEARGGLEQILKTETVIMEGTNDFQGVNAGFRMTLKRPNFVRIELDASPIVMLQSFDGTSAWMKSPLENNGNAVKMNDEQAQQLKSQADIDGPLIDYQRKGLKVQLRQPTELGDKSYLTIQIRQPNDELTYLYLDPDTYQIIRESNVRSVQGSGPIRTSLIKIETEYSDFRTFNGLTLPTRIKTFADGRIVSMLLIDRILVNQPVDDSVFTLN